jgi:hypothetical protein
LTAEAVEDEREANITLYYSRIREVCIHQCIYIFFCYITTCFSFLYRRMRSSRTNMRSWLSTELGWSIYRAVRLNYEFFFYQTLFYE